jgi:hypothetical protein
MDPTEINALHLVQENGGLEAVIFKNDEIIASQSSYCKTLFDPKAFKLFVQSGEVVKISVMGFDGKKIA